MSKITRRQFISHSSALVAALSTSHLLSPSLAFALGEGNGNILILLDNEGGCDTFQALPYSTGPVFNLLSTSLRPNIFIPAAQVQLLHTQTGAPNTIGFHPSFSRLTTESANHISLLKLCGITPGPDFSHETARNMYASGTFYAPKATQKGWLRRLMQHYSMDSMQVYGIKTGAVSDFTGEGNSPMLFENLDTYRYEDRDFGSHSCTENCTGLSDKVSNGQDDSKLARDIAKQIREQATKDTPLKDRFAAIDRAVEQSVDQIQSQVKTQATVGNYTDKPDGTGNVSEFCDACRTAAKIIKYLKSDPAKRNLSIVIRLARRGWDFHGNIVSGIANNVSDIDRGLGGLIQDLKAINTTSGTAWSKSAIYMYSEFSRTNRQNGTNPNAAGTDHAWGGHHVVFGGAVRHQILGDDPSTSELNSKNYVTPTLSHLSPLKSLVRHIGFDPSPIFTESHPNDISLNLFA